MPHEEVIARLDERVGSEGRRLFENFLRKVKRLERSDKVGSAAVPSMHTDAAEDEDEQ